MSSTAKLYKLGEYFPLATIKTYKRNMNNLEADRQNPSLSRTYTSCASVVKIKTTKIFISVEDLAKQNSSKLNSSVVRCRFS